MIRISGCARDGSAVDDRHTELDEQMTATKVAQLSERIDELGLDRNRLRECLEREHGENPNEQIAELQAVVNGQREEIEPSSRRFLSERSPSRSLNHSSRSESKRSENSGTRSSSIAQNAILLEEGADHSASSEVDREGGRHRRPPVGRPSAGAVSRGTRCPPQVRTRDARVFPVHRERSD